MRHAASPIARKRTQSGRTITHTVALLVAVVAACPAAACYVADDYRRPPASTQYDEAYDAWLATLAQELQGDPDPEIAYAGWLLDGLSVIDEPPPPPPPPPETDAPRSKAPPAPIPEPASGLAHLMRYAYCERSRRCDDGLAAWAAADAGNLFPLERAIANFQTRKIANLEQRILQATRYDEYTAARRALTAKIAARHDLTPPGKPAGYVAQPCSDADRFDPAAVVISRLSQTTFANFDALPHASSLDPAAVLHAADLMVAATGTPEAAERGVRAGVAAARSVPDRERYCRLQARRAALETALSRQMQFGAEAQARSRRFDAALATRNGIDAAEAVLREEGETPPPLDEAAIADCVADGTKALE